jgi:uncharacterized protein YdcH (DUF465 family)
MPATLRHVVLRFPQQAVLISKLERESDEFRSLCEDYELVVETLVKLETGASPSNETTLREYRSFLVDLELDIADALTNALR